MITISSSIRLLPVILSFSLSQFIILTSYAGEQKIITIPSAAMRKTLRATVVSPDSYAQSQRHYSVIYLLHGFGGDYTVWPRIVPLTRYSDSLQLLFVCPDGENSWYLDSPVKKRSRFETFIINEVVPFIDSTYRTWNRSEGRAIFGTSMGGHGAITLLARHQELFAGACAIAGIMDLSEFPFEWELPGILGSFAKNQQRWVDYSCINQIRLLKNRSKLIILDCGTEDFALKGNQEEHALLQKAEIPHYFYSLHGSHDFHYVSKVAAGHICFFAEKLLPAK